MKKRLLATFLALCLVIGLLPVSAMAAGEPVYDENWTDRIQFNDGRTHRVILRNVNIDRYDLLEDNDSAIEISNNTHVTLILEGDNYLKGDTNEPAIWVESGSSLTIEGNGSLDARAGTTTSGLGAAGIGGRYNEEYFGDITINGGTILAGGTVGGAGIGGGYVSGKGTQHGNITINGGYVKAIGGSSALKASAGAGIGGGENASFGGIITISGGVVYAQSGKESMVSIGGGGSIGVADISHGSFATDKPDGSPGNAVIVAPHAIGAIEDFPEWDGIFCSFNGGADTATIDENGTVVLNDADANIQVWGDPVVDYNLQVNSGTTLLVVANDRNDASSSLTMEKNYTLTNHGIIKVATSTISGDASKLVLKGGEEKTDGDGTLMVGQYGAVQVPLTKELVTLTPESIKNLTYNGTNQQPQVTVKLKLWTKTVNYQASGDYTVDYSKDWTNAGPVTIDLSSNGQGNLLEGDVKLTGSIAPADFSIRIDNSEWPIQQGGSGLMQQLPTADKAAITVDFPVEEAALETLKSGTLTWYTDPARQPEQEVTDEWLESLPESSKTEIYGSYTHSDSNFVNPKEDIVITLIVNKDPAPTVTVSGEHVNVVDRTLTTTYGELEQEQLSVSITVNGTPHPVYSPKTWESDNESVATVTEDGLVTFVGAGRATITATVEAYAGEYAKASGYVDVIVEPRSITVTSVKAVDREYDGTKDVEVTYTLAPDNFRDQEIKTGKISFSATGTMNDAAPGKDKPVTVSYSLTGDGHLNYKIPAPEIIRVNISEKSDPGVTPEEGALTITNNLKKTYLFHLDDLNPDVGSGAPLGNVNYEKPKVEVDAGSPYEGEIKVRIVNETLIVTVDAVDTSVEKTIGTVKVDLVTDHYGTMTGTIDLNTKNLDQGHSYGDITVKNVLDGNGADSSDVFSYTIKLENEPLSGSPAAFDEPVAYRGTGSVAGGAGGTVTPDAYGIIRFTLAGGEEITFSGNLNQDHKINYVITQLDSNGYTTTVTKAGDFTNGAVLPVSNPATGYLHCSHTGTGSGTVINEWAEIVFTNAKGTAQGGSLTYHANGGSGDPLDYYTTYTADPTATVSDNLWFTKVDYTFDSWNTQPDGSGIEYQPNSTITMNGNVDLYAQWIKNGSGNPDPEPGHGGDATQQEFELHYVTNGGKHLSVESEIRVWTKDYRDLPVPVREGYTFEGWYWDLRLTDRVTGDVKVDVPVVVLYAKWAEEETAAESTGVSRWLDTVNHTAYLSGYPDGTYRPDAPITRAEFAAVALAFANEPAAAGCSYTDVSANAWYYTYVAQASTYGWIGGYPDNTFRPDNKITRAEVCVIVNNMLGRAADQRYIDRNADELTSFADLTSNHWAYYTIMEATNSHKYSVDDGVESWSRVN